MKTIKTKADTEYYLVHRLLRLMGHLGIINSDKEMFALYKKFGDYAFSKLNLPKDGGDFTDIYMVFEQEKI